MDTISDSDKATDLNKFRKFSYKIGSVFCMTPWYDFEKAVLRKPTLNKVYSVISGITLGVLLIILMIIDPFDFDENIFEKILHTISAAISILLTEYLIFGSAFIKQHSWKILLIKLSELHKIMRNWCDRKIIASFHMQFFLGHLFFLVAFVYQACVWYTLVGPKSVPALTYSLISEYYCFLYTLVSSNLVLVIKCVYENLNELLKRTAKEYSIKICNESDEKLFVNRLLNMGRYYRSVTRLVDYYNDIFGWATALIFLNSIVQLLRCANLILRIMEKPQISWTIIILLICSSILSMGESVYIIVCCDLASSTGKKMRRLCHKLQENFDVCSRSRKELFKLADIATSYKPEFTAANFFVIRKGTILGIISIATTYLIVIIQFNAKLHEKYYVKEKP